MQRVFGRQLASPAFLFVCFNKRNKVMSQLCEQTVFNNDPCDPARHA